MSPGAGGPRVRVGVDAVPVARMARLVTRYPAAEERLFTERELEYCRSRRLPHEHMAACFAAKEAVLKALGTGLGPGMRWRDVEVRHDPSGRPAVALAGAVAAWAERAGIGDLDVSLTHTADLAIAQVVGLVRP